MEEESLAITAMNSLTDEFMTSFDGYGYYIKRFADCILIEQFGLDTTRRSLRFVSRSCQSIADARQLYAQLLANAPGIVTSLLIEDIL